MNDDRIAELRKMAIATLQHLGSTGTNPTDAVDAIVELVMAKVEQHMGAAATESETLGMGVKIDECPLAFPFVYCQECRVSPCPMGLDKKPE